MDRFLIGEWEHLCSGVRNIFHPQSRLESLDCDKSPTISETARQPARAEDQKTHKNDAADASGVVSDPRKVEHVLIIMNSFLIST